MNIEELGTLIENLKKDDFDITWVSKDKLIVVLEKIQDTEDVVEQEVIKKVVVHMNKVATGYIDENGKEFAPNYFYKLPENLEYLNGYLPTSEEPIEEVVEDTLEEPIEDVAKEKTAEEEKVADYVVLTEEEEMVAEIKELLKDDNNYDKICEALKTAETKLNTFIKKSNETINKKKTVIFNLAAKKEVLERGVKDTIIMKKIKEIRENKKMIDALKENETNK